MTIFPRSTGMICCQGKKTCQKCMHQKETGKSNHPFSAKMLVSGRGTCVKKRKEATVNSHTNGNWTIWRCISYIKRGNFQPAMVVCRRVPLKTKPSICQTSCSRSLVVRNVSRNQSTQAMFQDRYERSRQIVTILTSYDLVSQTPSKL